MILVVGRGVDRELVAHRALEYQLGIIDVVELDVPQEVGEHGEMARSALIPVGRHVGLRELQTDVADVEPVDALAVGMHLQWPVGLHLGEIQPLQVSTEREVLFGQLRRLGQFPVGVVDVIWILHHEAVDEILFQTIRVSRAAQPVGRGRTEGNGQVLAFGYADGGLEVGGRRQNDSRVGRRDENRTFGVAVGVAVGDGVGFQARLLVHYLSPYPGVGKLRAEPARGHMAVAPEDARHEKLVDRIDRYHSVQVGARELVGAGGLRLRACGQCRQYRQDRQYDGYACSHVYPGQSSNLSYSSELITLRASLNIGS